MVAKKLIYYIIPLVVLVLVVMWQFGPEGLFDEMKESVLNVIGLVPDVTIGAEELSGEKPTIPQEHGEAVERLAGTIKEMIGSDKNNCFANHGVLPNLGEKGTSINFQLKGDKTVMIIGGGAGGKQEISYEELDFKPCVIAGAGSTHEKANDNAVAENFYDNFLREDSACKGCDMWVCPEECAVPYWSIVNQIIIKEKEKIIYDDVKGNLIEGDFEDQGWLYKNNNDYICFFPTFSGDPFGTCNGDGSGLDNDCMEKFDELDKC